MTMSQTSAPGLDSKASSGAPTDGTDAAAQDTTQEVRTLSESVRTLEAATDHLQSLIGRLKI